MATIKKVVFIMGSLFCKKEYDLFGIKTLEKNGFEVEVWEIINFMRSDISRSVLANDDIIHTNLKIFKTKKEILTALDSIDKSVFVFTILYFEPIIHFIYRALSRKKVKFALFEAWYAPFGDRKTFKRHSTVVERIKMRCSWDWLKSFIVRHMPLWSLNIKPADYVFAGGAKSFGRIQPQNNNTKLVFLHAPNYDRYLIAKKCSIEEGKNFVVFLDEFLPFHPDFLYMRLKNPTSADNYYASLRRLFDAIEKKLDCKIVIAAHPRSNYKEHSEKYYGDREVIKGASEGLVRNCKLVISHSSSSLGFAVLFNKPVLLISTDEIQNSRINVMIKVMAEYLGTDEIINADKQNYSLDVNKVLQINEKAYRQYYRDYIKKPGTEEGYLWELIAKHIHNIGEQNV
jgi:hypothetical protein